MADIFYCVGKQIFDSMREAKKYCKKNGIDTKEIKKQIVY